MSDKNQNEVLVSQQLNETNHNDEMESLKHRLSTLTKEKNTMETDFGVKRARFKEIILKKEGNYLIGRH